MSLKEGAMMKSERYFRTFEEYQLESLQDPRRALIYLAVMLDEFEKNNDIETLLYSLKTIVKAHKLSLN